MDAMRAWTASDLFWFDGSRDAIWRESELLRVRLKKKKETFVSSRDAMYTTRFLSSMAGCVANGCIQQSLSQSTRHSIIHWQAIRIYRNSKPTPTCTPRLHPSLWLTMSGTPTLTSTRTGSRRYKRPMPADTEGRVSVSRILSSRDRSERRKAPSVSNRANRGSDILLSRASSLPALTHACVFTGQ